MDHKKFRLQLLVATVAALALGTLLRSAPIDPVAWKPHPAQALQGELAPNQALLKVELLGEAEFEGPEDIAVDPLGQVYAGLADGRIVRLSETGIVETIAQTGGRPLGLDWDNEGNLVVADAGRGLLRVTPHGEIEQLADRAEGQPFLLCDDVDVASDGRIYFSDASDRFQAQDYLLDLLEGRPHGRLLRYDPATKRVEVLARDLHFANGVALSLAEDFVLINETWRYRVQRYWLQGPKAGTLEPWIEGLPGFPDGISSNGRGVFWLAIPSLRKPIADRMAPWPIARRALSRLPRSWWPQPERYGLVLALDEQGQVLASYHDPTGERVSAVTSVEEAFGALWLGKLSGKGLARLPLPEPPGTAPRMAVTIDDLPGLSWGPRDPLQANQALLATLRQHGVTATGFVNCDRGRQDILRRWLEAGMELGNHQAAHDNLNKTPPETWLQGVYRCTDALTALTGLAPVHFRYPYLFNGPTPAIRDQVRAAVEASGLTVAPVSIDNHEWKLAQLYAQALSEGDEASAAQLAEAFAGHILRTTHHFQALARARLGRDIAHVLLLHDTALDADQLGPALESLQQEGFQFIPLSEALQDPVYALPNDYRGKWGISWLYRIPPAMDEHPWLGQEWRRLFDDEGGFLPP